MMPEITVAIPFYNAEKYLAQAIESVLDQTLQDFVLLLIDDGSTDHSLKIARQFAEDPRVQIISDGKNQNLGYRLNEIPKYTTTEYLARMDADDIMHPQRLEIQLNFLKNHPETDVVGSNIYSINEHDFVTGARLPFRTHYAEKVHSFWHPTIMAKTGWFRKNPYDVKAYRVEDAELWLRTFSTNNFIRLSSPLLFYREFGSAYYKKYIAGFPGVWYSVKKSNFEKNHVLFALKYVLMTFVYAVLQLFGAENILVQRRNQVMYEKKHYKTYAYEKFPEIL